MTNKILNLLPHLYGNIVLRGTGTMRKLDRFGCSVMLSVWRQSMYVRHGQTYSCTCCNKFSSSLAWSHAIVEC